MAAPSFKSATVVLGMHRSGTSALAGALRLAGLSGAKSVVPASGGNERGFWESAAIKAFDDDLLQMLGQVWHGVSPIRMDALSKRQRTQTTKRARGILASEYEHGAQILLKEPRLCRLLPVWEPLLQEEAGRVAYPLIIRNPIEVANSLVQRNDFDLNHSLMLWVRYCLDAEFHTRGRLRAFVSYAALLDDPLAALEMLAKRLDLPVRLNSSNSESIDQYLTPDLRHHREADERALVGKSELVKDTYEVLQGWCEGQSETAADHEKLDRAREELDQIAVAVGETFESARLDRKRWIAARSQAEQATSELSGLRDSSEKLQNVLDSLAEQSAAISALAESGSESAKTLERAFKKSLSTVREPLQSALERLAQIGGSIDGLSQSIAVSAEDDRKAAEMVASIAADQRAGLADIRTEFAAAAAVGAEQAELLSQVIVAISDRQKLQDALALSMKTGAEAAARADRLAAESARLTAESARNSEQFARELAGLQTEHQVSISRLQEQHQESVAELQSQHQASVADLQEQHRRSLAQLQEQHEGSLLQLQEEHRRGIAELDERHQRTAEQLEAEKRAREEVANRAEALDAELQRTKRKYRAAQWDAEREKRAHASTQAELQAAQAALATYRASRLWRTYTALAASAGRISPAQARGKRKSRSRQLQSISASGLFDRDWYLATYPDVATAGSDPLLHFFETGWREGRDPGPSFATSAYLKAHPDVARSGMNPLFHYTEFGQSEGREIRAHHERKEPPAAAVHEFAEPFPVFRGELTPDKPTLWRRSYGLDANDGRLVTGGELLLGYATTPGQRSAIEGAFERLAGLSGLTAPSPLVHSNAKNASAVLVDAWYTTRAELRTRWRDEGFPFVVRAYQHDPSHAGRLSLVAEALIASELDVVDASLTNPFCPLLFLFADCDGTLRGSQLMAFPSLCRGGLHYPELVNGISASLDPLEFDAAAAVRLQHARSSSDRLIGSISVDEEGSDGTSPMFDPEFRHWLERVARIPIQSADQTAGDAPSKDLSATLVLASDMVPTIQILGEVAGKGERVSEAVPLPLLVAGEEPSQPALLVGLPRDALAILSLGAPGYPAPWPRFVPRPESRLPQNPGAAAIRVPDGRELTDSELLVPASASLLSLDEAADLTWFISPAEWNPAELSAAIRALSLQEGAERHRVGIVGETDAASATAVKSFFDGRAHFFADLRAATEALDTEFAGHLGPGVLLHDGRSVSTLAALLSDSAIASASCVLVGTEKQGKAWHVSVVDGGTIATDLSNGRTAAIEFKDQRLPWRSCFAVARPPRDLWIARASSVKSWVAGEAPEPLRKGLHLCTSLVTASYVSGRLETSRELPLPSASAGRSTKTRVLVG